MPSRSCSPSSSASTESSTDAGTATCSLYLHVPFCVVKCGYCDFHSLADVASSEMESVVDAMLRELEYKLKDVTPYTIFLGGGTPTHLPEPLLRRLLRGIQSLVRLERVREYSCEANPESLSQDKLLLLRDHGVTRVSIGIQSFDEDRLRFLDRAHGVAQSEAALDRARRLRCFDLSLDLIYGLPGQDLEAWSRDLERALSWETEHLSAYQLTFEPGTALRGALERGAVTELRDDEQRAFFEWTHDRLAEAGRPAYEISNFARPGAECCHNLQYWDAGDYLGVGPSAAEHIQGRRSSNWKSLQRYCTEVKTRGRADASEEHLDPEQRLREAIWLGLRRVAGIQLRELEQRFDCRPELGPELERCIAMGWLQKQGSRYWIPREHLAYADGIAQRFL